MLQFVTVSAVAVMDFFVDTSDGLIGNSLTLAIDLQSRVYIDTTTSNDLMSPARLKGLM